MQFSAVAAGRVAARVGGEGGIKWKVAEVEESDKQIKKASEGEGDKAGGGGKENKRVKVLRREREKSSRGEKERERREMEGGSLWTGRL